MTLSSRGSSGRFSACFAAAVRDAAYLQVGLSGRLTGEVRPEDGSDLQAGLQPLLIRFLKTSNRFYQDERPECPEHAVPVGQPWGAGAADSGQRPHGAAWLPRPAAAERLAGSGPSAASRPVALIPEHRHLRPRWTPAWPPAAPVEGRRRQLPAWARGAATQTQGPSLMGPSVAEKMPYFKRLTQQNYLSRLRLSLQKRERINNNKIQRKEGDGHRGGLKTSVRTSS